MPFNSAILQCREDLHVLDASTGVVCSGWSDQHRCRQCRHSHGRQGGKVAEVHMGLYNNPARLGLRSIGMSLFGFGWLSMVKREEENEMIAKRYRKSHDTENERKRRS